MSAHNYQNRRLQPTTLRRSSSYPADGSGRGSRQRRVYSSGILPRSFALPKLSARFQIIGAVAVLIVIVLAISIFALQGNANSPAIDLGGSKDALLLQTDSRWAKTPYAGSTIEESGCGPTSMTMVYRQLTGKKDYDPIKMAAFSEEHGFVEGGNTTWLFMSEGARKLGLSAEEMPADASTLKNHLKSGGLVICSMRPGDFTATGHLIVLSGVDGDGRLIVKDPNSKKRSARTWDAKTILSQCKNLWAYSK